MVAVISLLAVLVFTVAPSKITTLIADSIVPNQLPIAAGEPPVMVFLSNINAGYFRYYTSSTQNGANGNIALYKYNKEWTNGGGDTPGGSKQKDFTYDSHDGWSVSTNATDKETYYLLNGNAYIESPSFSFKTIESIVVKMRYFGGNQYGTLKASFTNDIIGTVSATTNK